MTDVGILVKPDVQRLEMSFLSVFDVLFELLSKRYFFQAIRRICTGKLKKKNLRNL